jgi:hypothetical protein
VIGYIVICLFARRYEPAFPALSRKLAFHGSLSADSGFAGANKEEQRLSSAFVMASRPVFPPPPVLGRPMGAADMPIGCALAFRNCEMRL